MIKLPPYGRELQERLRGDFRRWVGTSPDGRRPSIFLLTGPAAWAVAHQWRTHRLLTLLPPGEDPDLYDWRLCRYSHPLLLWRCGDVEGDEIFVLLKAVMRDGCQRVFDPAAQHTYRREVRYVA